MKWEVFTVLLCQLSHEVGSAEGSVTLHGHVTLAQYRPVYKHASQMHQLIRVGSRLPQNRVAFVIFSFSLSVFLSFSLSLLVHSLEQVWLGRVFDV